MPIWVKCIFLLWAISFVLLFMVKVWANDLRNIPRILKKDYPGWIIVSGALSLLSIMSIIPLVVWFIFFR